MKTIKYVPRAGDDTKASYVITRPYTEENLTLAQQEAYGGAYTIGYEPDVLMPMTAEEVLRLFLPRQINDLQVDDNTALRMKRFHPAFEDIVGQKVVQGFRFTYGDKLWQTIQPEMTIQSQYPPGEGMESLYSEVCETHSGTEKDPIPYGGNMALSEGLYYHQDGILYRCTRDTDSPVYHALNELVGLYVEKIV